MSYNRLTFGVVRSGIVGSSLISDVWARWLGTSVIPAINNSTPLAIPGPFANDAAAQAGGVPVGSTYFKSDGSMWARLA